MKLSAGLMAWLALAVLATGSGILPGVTTEPDESGACTEDVTGQVSLTGPGAVTEPDAVPPSPMDIPEEYFKIDSLFSRLFVTPGDEYVIAFDYQTASLADSIVPYELTGLAVQAMEASPDWLRDDLEWSFHLLSTANQDRYANLILGVANPATRDEVAFQVAHLSWTVLADPNWDETLIEENAAWIYEIDGDLQYVQVNDYAGEGYYSTTEYRFLSATDDTVDVEIPRDLYYWWIVMPRVSDEKPLQDASVYNLFWREYLYTQFDSGYPLLSEVMAPVEVLWDGQQHNWSGGRPFTDDMMAVDALGKWCTSTVPFPASGDRPIQPNVIAHEHDGNCGELQDLLCAAGRTVLIPMLCTMDILEDHVWCEMWWDDAWVPYQVELGGNMTQIANPGIAYDVDHGGSKECSCIWDWRNDGWTWQSIATYSQVCTLTVEVTDSVGVPVDNARVSIASEQYYSPYNVSRGTWGVTDQDGLITFILGNNQNYYVSVASLLGSYPSSGWAALINDSEAGEHYYWSWMTPSPMPSLDVTGGEPGWMSKYLIEVEYDLPFDVQADRDFYANPRNEYAWYLEDGHLPFFIVNRDNLEAYMAGEPFEAYEVAGDLSSNHVYFFLANSEDFFVVFSGREHVGFSSLADVTVRLWEHDGTGLHGAGPLHPSLEVAPNPFAGELTLRFTSTEAGSAVLTVYDLTGRVVATRGWELPEAGENALAWDASDASGEPLAAGTYFARLRAPGLDSVQRVVLVR
jgi:hypothetical protein